MAEKVTKAFLPMNVFFGYLKNYKIFFSRTGLVGHLIILFFIWCEDKNSSSLSELCIHDLRKEMSNVLTIYSTIFANLSSIITNVCAETKWYTHVHAVDDVELSLYKPYAMYGFQFGIIKHPFTFKLFRRKSTKECNLFSRRTSTIIRHKG